MITFPYRAFGLTWSYLPRLFIVYVVITTHLKLSLGSLISSPNVHAHQAFSQSHRLRFPCLLPCSTLGWLSSRPAAWLLSGDFSSTTCRAFLSLLLCWIPFVLGPMSFSFWFHPPIFVEQLIQLHPENTAYWV